MLPNKIFGKNNLKTQKKEKFHGWGGVELDLLDSISRRKTWILRSNNPEQNIFQVSGKKHLLNMVCDIWCEIFNRFRNIAFYDSSMQQSSRNLNFQVAGMFDNKKRINAFFINWKDVHGAKIWI